jgi:hypothetical protein
VNNKFTHAVDFWLDSIVVGFITEFAVDTAKSFSAVEHEFLRKPRGRYILSLYTSIKILLCNKGRCNDKWDQTTKLPYMHGGMGKHWQREEEWKEVRIRERKRRNLWTRS